MTNLLISFPAALAAIDKGASDDVDSDYSFANTVSGKRSQYFKLASTSSSCGLTYSYSSSITPDHIIIARADIMQGSVDDVEVLSGSSPVAITTSEYSDTSYDTATLYGDNYVAKISGASTAQYWNVTYTAIGTSYFIHSKTYLGEFFDFEHEPIEWSFSKAGGGKVFTTSDGTSYPAETEDSYLMASFVWQGITDAKAEEFTDYAFNQQGRYCFLYADSDTTPLAGNKILHVELDRGSVGIEKIYNDYNVVSATFLEMTG